MSECLKCGISTYSGMICMAPKCPSIDSTRVPIAHTEFSKEAQEESKTTSDGWSTDYYKIPEGAKELGDLIDHKDMNFNVGNIFKASYRLGEKEGTDAMYDLNKIIWFATREKQKLERSA